MTIPFIPMDTDGSPLVYDFIGQSLSVGDMVYYFDYKSNTFLECKVMDKSCKWWAETINLSQFGANDIMSFWAYSKETIKYA